MPTSLGSYILVVGGAGYIGSHMTLVLQQAGYKVVVLDSLVTGYADAVIDAELVVGDMGDQALLEQLFMRYTFSTVMHFASFIEVGESMREPAKYYHNNVAATLILLKVLLKYKVRSFIFSSTAAIYGEPLYTPIDEKHVIAPINPYGRSKWVVEQILQDYAQSYELRYAILRYFNAAGADPLGRVGERHQPESHLIPIVLQVAMRQRRDVTVYGRDYATIDGTCLRDYIHVTDICTAHLQALQALHRGASNIICNLGTGRSYSVQQVIDTAQRVTGCHIPVADGVRRAGDPAILTADVTLARRLLTWQPQYADLDTIIYHAWQFMNVCKERVE
jgi:UDP-glucose 4-epimerase